MFFSLARENIEFIKKQPERFTNNAPMGKRSVNNLSASNEIK